MTSFAPIVRQLTGRLLHSVVTLWLVTIIFFALTDMLSGDFASATATRDTPPEQIEALRHELGLFASAPQRYVDWLTGVLGGDLGTSYWARKPVTPLVVERFGYSAWLMMCAVILAVPTALILALIAVARRGRLFDRVSSSLSIAVMSFPEFLIAYGLMGLLAVRFQVFPVHTMFQLDIPLSERLWGSALPVLSLAAVAVTPIFRMARAALINELSADYVQMAQLKGLKRGHILVRHVLPNAAAPIANVIMVTIANLLVGLVIIETIFSYPGIGELLIIGVKFRDVPLVLACALTAAFVFISLNFVADAIAVLSNPRLRYPAHSKASFLFSIPSGGKILLSRPAQMTAAVAVVLVAVGALAYNGRFNQVTPVDVAVIPPPSSKVRDQLTVNVLLGKVGRRAEFLHYDYFAPYGEVKGARHALEGNVRISAFKVRTRRARSEGAVLSGDFPGFEFRVTTHNNTLLPIDRDRLLKTFDGRSHVILSPGRVWHEPGDGNWSRGSFPFTISPVGASRPSYGVATFLFNDQAISQVRVQIAQETANWAQFDLWGQGAAEYTPQRFDETADAHAAYDRKQATQIDIRPWSELAEKHDRSFEHFDGSGNRENITVSGLMVDDIFYLRACRTRAGLHPYCRDMRHGVFSVTKSLGAAVSMLWLAKKYGPGVFQEKLTDYVTIPAEHDGWKNVTFGHALDMATGIGTAMPYRVDHYVEVDMTSGASRVWNARSIRDKLDAMGKFNNYPWGPGEVTRYRTSDTTALSAAMEAFLRKREGPNVDLWDSLTQEVFVPLGIDRLPVRRSIEPDGSPGTPLLGAGLYVTIEETLKIARLLQDHGQYDGKQLLHRELTKRAVSTKMDRGFPTGWHYREGGEAHYAMSFWLTPHKRWMFGCSVRVPIMAGFGGNYVIIMPNRTIGLRFADGHDDDSHTWNSFDMRSVSDRVRPLC